MFVAVTSIFTVGIIIQIFWIYERTRGIDDITVKSDVITSSVPETFTAFSRMGFGVMRVGGREEWGRRGRENWRNEGIWGIACGESSVTSERLCCCCGCC